MHSIAARNIRSAVPRGVSAKLGFVFLAEGAGRAATVCFRVMRCDLGFLVTCSGGGPASSSPVIFTQADCRWEVPGVRRDCDGTAIATGVRDHLVARARHRRQPPSIVIVDREVWR